MKAWQYTRTHEPLSLNEVPHPTAGPGEVVIATKAAGMCHSDLGVLNIDGFTPYPLPSPVTLGHEVSGVVDQVGAGVTGWKAGDRVAIALEVGPTDPVNGPVGFARDGGYAPYISATERSLVALPDNVPFSLGAIATDAGVTAHHAIVTVGGIGEGDRVGIIGYGGLGQIGAQVAAGLGAQVFVAEPKEELWSSARDNCAERVAVDITEFADDNLDVIVDFAGFGVTTNNAILTVRPGGRVVQIGLGRTEASINTAALVAKNITLVGSLGGTRDDLVGVIELLAKGRVNAATTEENFAEIPEALERLERGEVRGRLVARFDA